MKGARLVVFMWFVAIAVIVWRSVKVDSAAPPASAFVGTGIVYPIAAAITALPFASASLLGGTFAVGWTLNLLYTAVGSQGSSHITGKDPAPPKDQPKDQGKKQVQPKPTMQVGGTG